MAKAVIVREDLDRGKPRLGRETRATRATQIGAALASPVGVMLVVPLLVVLVGVLSTLVGQRALLETNLSAVEELLKETTRTASRRLERTLFQNESVLDRLEDVARRADPNDPDTTRVMLRDLFLGRPGMTQLYIGYADGHFLGMYEEGGRLLFQDSRVTGEGKTRIAHYIVGPQQDITFLREEDSNYDPRKRTWYREAVRTSDRIWTEPYAFFTTGRTGVTRASPVFARDGTVAAVVGVDYDATALSRLFLDANRSWVRVLVSDDQGTILAYPSARQKIEAMPNSDEALTYQKLDDPVLNAYFAPHDVDETLHGLRVVHAGKTRFLSAESSMDKRGLNWKVVALAPEQTVLSVLRHYQRQSLLIALGAVCLALIVSWLFARHVVRARRQVAEAREEAAQAIREAAELGSYRLIDCLGRGGMGEVWRAEHRLLARQAAVKLIKDDILSDGAAEQVKERFKREAKAIAALRSRNTIALFDYGVTNDGTFFYAMEMLDGIDLETLVESYGAQPPGRVISVLVQACNSLAEAHDAGLVHRDIKPANLFLCRAADEVDLVKVLDFGLVRGSDDDEAGAAEMPTPHADVGKTTQGVDPSSSPEQVDFDMSSGRLTRAGDYLGTPAFMAPEQALAQEIDGRADLYALGCVAWWLLTAQLPFEEPSAVALMLAHMQKEPEGLSTLCPNIPPALEAIVLRCLAKDPSARPSDARELAAQLRAIALDEHQWFTDEMAQAWWREYRPDASVAAISVMKTQLQTSG